MTRLFTCIAMVLALILPAVALAADPYGSRSNPVEFGEPYRIGDWELSVVSYNPDAFHYIEGISRYSVDPPADGNRYALIRLKAKYVGGEIGDLGWDLTSKAVGASNVGYDYNSDCDSVPESAYSIGDVFPGGEVEYYECFEVKSSDADSLELYVAETFESKITFFALFSAKGTPVATP